MCGLQSVPETEHPFISDGEIYDLAPRCGRRLELLCYDPIIYDWDKGTHWGCRRRAYCGEQSDLVFLRLWLDWTQNHGGGFNSCVEGAYLNSEKKVLQPRTSRIRLPLEHIGTDVSDFSIKCH
jgi:hypothetical protein